MSTKEIVMEAVNQLPADASFDQIMREIEILASIKKGEEAAEAGRIVPHEKVKALVDQWTAK